jgi:hypothetical protein
VSDNVGSSGRVGDELAISAAKFFVLAIAALALLSWLHSISAALP